MLHDEIEALHQIGRIGRAQVAAMERTRRLEHAERGRALMEEIARMDGHASVWASVEKGSRKRNTTSFS